SMNSQSILPASCTSSCLMLMIWSSRARNRSADPVISCFFGRIAPSDAATESCFSIRGNRENEIASFQVSDTETLQSQVNKAGKKRLSLSGLEILHGRLNNNPETMERSQRLFPTSLGWCFGHTASFDQSPCCCLSCPRPAEVGFIRLRPT